MTSASWNRRPVTKDGGEAVAVFDDALSVVHGIRT